GGSAHGRRMRVCKPQPGAIVGGGGWIRNRLQVRRRYESSRHHGWRRDVVVAIPFAVSRELQHAGVPEQTGARLVRRLSVSVGAGLLQLPCDQGGKRWPEGPVNLVMAVMAAKAHGWSGRRCR